MLVALALAACPARAQVADSARAERARVDSARVDTASATGRTDSLRVRPGRPAGGARELREPVTFGARDAFVLVFDSAGVGDVGTLRGEANVTYGTTKVEAEIIDLFLDRDEFRARGVPVDTGIVGRPRFASGEESFTSEGIAFNLRTERGRFLQATTRLDEGFVRAAVVKVAEDSTVYASDALYTTCDCVDDPSYSLRARRMKIVDGKWVYTGPIRLYLFNIPTPLWLPFGYLPATEGRRAGPLAPTYGEDERGFYLRGGGWYWPLSDYADVQVTGGVWSRGSVQITPRFRYARRYFYAGSLELDYGRNRSGEREDPGFQVLRTTALRWTHGQTVGANTNFNANVNLSSSGYLRTQSEQFRDRVRQEISSTINFSTRWPRSGRSLNLALSQRQVLATGAADLTLPNASFSQGDRRPFKRTGPARGRERWYETVSYRYSGTLTNTFSFNPNRDALLARGDTLGAEIAWYEALVSPSKYRRATGRDDEALRLRVAHSVPVSATFDVRNVPLLGGFRANVVPNVQYSENWYVSTVRREGADTLFGYVETRRPGFFALRQAAASLSANTTVYGLLSARVGRYDGLRHTLRPSLGVTFTPDYAARPFNYFRAYTDTTGRRVRYPIVADVPLGRQAAITFSADNVFETRRVREDSAGVVTRTPLTLLNVSASGSYNVAADSFRLSDLNVAARTSLGRFEINGNAVLSPYRLRADGFTRSPDLLIGSGFRFARLSTVTLSARTSFASRRRGEARPSQRSAFGPPTGFDGRMPSARGGTPFEGYPGAAAPYGPTIGGAPYADFSIPFSASFDAGFAYTPALVTDARRFIVNTSFDASLTPNWKLQGQSGYDFAAGQLSTTNLSILRDFECWEMSFSWVPFGSYTSYAFNLQVKSGKLRELLRIQQPRQDVRGRFGGLTGR